MKHFKLIYLFSFISISITAQIGFETQTIIDFSTGTQAAKKVLSADINNDGRIDILGCGGNELDVSKIYWYKNIDTPDGFSTQIIISDSLIQPTGMYTADIDGDNDLDLVVCSYQGKIVWYENLDGLGNFSSANLITSLTEGATAVFATDIDNDGDIDVLSSSISDNKIAWYENLNGVGDFGDQQIISTQSQYMSSVFSIDIDNDGDMDVIASSRGDNRILWYENLDGLGNFSEQNILGSLTYRAEEVYATDLDYDGDIDIIASSEISSTGNESKIVWFENTDGQGSFSLQQVIYNDGIEIKTAHADDINNDGFTDIVFSSHGFLYWVENENGQAIFGTPKIVNSSYITGIESLATTDIDNDGDKDILTASFGYDRISLFKNADDGENFQDEQIITKAAREPNDAKMADIDNDGDLDIYYVSSSWFMAWHENLDGAYTFSQQKRYINTGLVFPHSAHAADIDADGDLDILTGSYNGQKIIWFENTDGEGTFLSHSVNTGNSPVYDVYPVDFNNDEKLDILSPTAFLGGGVEWYKNNGAGVFNSASSFPYVTSHAYAAYPGDIDNDGAIDVVAGYGVSDKIVWFKNINNQETFELQQEITTDIDEINSLFLSDLDNDGDLDLISSSEDDNKIAWYENTDGLGNFGPQIIISEEAIRVSHIHANDIDGDNDNDIIFSTYGSQQIGWIENIDGQGNFGVLQTILIIDDFAASSVYAADIEGDGDLDIISTAYNHVFLHINNGLSFNEIRGVARFDIDNNGCDESDYPLSNLQVYSVKDTIGYLSTTIPNGFYQNFTPEEGQFSSSLSVPDYYHVNPELDTTLFVGIGNRDTVNFCISSSNQEVNDLNVVILPITESRLGFNAEYQIAYENLGLDVVNGEISFKFDNSKLAFVESSEVPEIESDSVYIFSFSDLYPLQSGVIDLTFNILTPPEVDLGDSLKFTSNIFPSQDDLTPLDNTSELNQVVIGSFDPNDIIVLEGSKIEEEETNEYLHYLIRFQNTGTASAVNVKIDNILDQNLDWNTFQLINSSHSNNIQISHGNEFSFVFNNIYLPDSTSNFEDSNGFVSYKIKPKSNINIGDIISNQADIYFDFNDPVETNTVMTEVIGVSQNFDIYSNAHSSISPIPSSNFINVETDFKLERINIYDYSGKLIQVLTNLEGVSQIQIDINHLSSGLYLCKFYSQDNKIRSHNFIKM